MGKYFVTHGEEVSGFYSRTVNSAKEAAKFCNTKYFSELDSLIEVSDTLFITVTDGAIKEVWDCIAAKDVKGKSVCHFSGSLSSDIFSNAEQAGVSVCSLHPIYAFSNKFTAYQNLTEAIFTVEGDEQAVADIYRMFEKLPNRLVLIYTEAKTRYHAAVSMASNHVIGLLSMAVKMLEEAGIESTAAYEMLTPLVKNNVEAALKYGCEQALTGPIERNDLGTVRHHLEVLSEEQKAVYDAIGTELVRISEKKHTERNYRQMKELLRKESE